MKAVNAVARLKNAVEAANAAAGLPAAVGVVSTGPGFETDLTTTDSPAARQAVAAVAKLQAAVETASAGAPKNKHLALTQAAEEAVEAATLAGELSMNGPALANAAGEAAAAVAELERLLTSSNRDSSRKKPSHAAVSRAN